MSESGHAPESEPLATSLPAPASPPPYPSAQFAHVVDAVRALEHPKQVGPYVIQQLVGEGGMGAVYRAEQRAPIHRIVAVKLIKLGMDTREVIARFESERQALALMNHPNVARVFDAGATDTGRPYFVMEFVAGEPITHYCDKHRLTVNQRLELFTQACDAIQHAHQKAIIHRDLKPSNILVTEQDGRAVVKVIDFGVAKATAQKLTERTLFTQTGQLVGTPEYMSPEQAEMSGLDVDTRSDIYSLGVVLYELLAGALPFEASTLRSAGYHEIQRIIREVDPPRPSTRLSKLGKGADEIARLRRTVLETLERQLKSELEWIPLKAMHKERSRRYASATELSEDIDNYLHTRPLRAAPDSAAYRLRKFFGRNRAGVAASAAMVFLLIAGIVATTWQAVRATRAERVAHVEKREAQRQRQLAIVASENVREVNRFLTDDLLASASPDVTRGREMTVREALDRAAHSIAQRFEGRPLTEAAVRSALADTYDALGRSETALSHAQVALELNRRALGDDHEDALSAAQEVGRQLNKLNRLPEAEPLLRDALDRARRALGDEHPVTLDGFSTLAMTLRMQERFAEAEPIYRQVLDATRRVHGSDSEKTAQALNNLAVLFNTQRRAAEAEPLYREALAIREKLLGTDHPSYLGTLGNLSRVLHDQGKLDEAEAMLRQVLAVKRRVLKDDHPETTLTMNNLASLLSDRGRFEEAEPLHREALVQRQRVLGEDDIDTLQSTANLGHTLASLQRYDEAEPLLRTAMEKRRRVLGEAHPYTIGTTINLGMVYVWQHRFADAEPLFARLCSPEVQAALPPQKQAQTLCRWGTLLAKLKQVERAEPVLLESRRRLIETDQSESGGMREVLAALIDVCQQANRPDDAARWRAELAALPPPATTSTQPTTAPTP